MPDEAEAKLIAPVGAAIGISFRANVGDGKEIVFQTHVDQQIDAKALNAALDKLRIATERQAAYGDLEKLEIDLERHITALQGQDTESARIETAAKERHAGGDRRGPVKLSVAEQKAKENFQASRLKFVEMIERLETQIIKTKAKIG